MTSKFLAIILVLSTSAAAWGATYQWCDDSGVMHFTDNPDRVPARYLTRVKELPSSGGEVKGPQPVAPPAPQAAIAATGAEPDSGKRNPQKERLTRELKAMRDALSVKRGELDRLRHRWAVAKGRNPTAEERKEFEKKLGKGRVAVQDNPYINKNPLSTPAPARIKYYEKLEEIRGDEERVRQLEEALSRL